MSLIKKPTMTEKRLAANRANGWFSRGATTPEGKERAGAANLRHGLYSRTGHEALRTLAAHPSEFAHLLATLEPDSRTKIWNFANYLWQNDKQKGCQNEGASHDVL